MIGKYLVIYTERDYDGPWGYSDILQNDYYDDLERAKRYISYLKAFEKEQGFKFISFVEVKEIPVVISDSEIERLREEQRLEDEKEKRRHEVWIEECERADLKRLKEKYEK